jgi:glycogen operon protein
VEADAGYLNNPDNHFLAYRIDCTESGARDRVASIYVAYNGWSDRVTATLPANLPGKRWYRAADTAGWMESRDNFNAPDQEELLAGASYTLAGRSVLLLIEQ